MFYSYPAALRSFRSLLTVLIFVSGCSKDDDPVVDKDEGVYLNEIYASAGDDWVELYNNAESAKDVGGYKIYDDEALKYSLPAETAIPAKGFLILFCDDTGSGLHTNFKLSSTGETIYLENNSGQVIDFVTFPGLDDGEVYGRFPDGTGNFGVSGISSQGTANGESRAAVIRSVDHTPLIPLAEDPVIVNAEVVSNAGISNVTLFYKIDNGSYVSVAMTGSGDQFEATIPALNTTGSVAYYISATNNSSQTTRDPFNAPDESYSYIINTDPLPLLKINEFMAFNTACCPDTDGDADEFDDWIEIHNDGFIAVDIGGMYLSDDKNNPFKSMIPDTDPALTTIAPGGFIVIWADEEGNQGPLHVNFQLNSEGEDVGLFYIDGRAIDSYTFGPQSENKSMGRSGEGGLVWSVMNVPTPGLPNE
jgi:hypothetical protein